MIYTRNTDSSNSRNSAPRIVLKDICNPLLAESVNVRFTEEEFTMRSRSMYDRHAEMASNDPESASVYGVKARSELNNSRYFHVVDGLPSDIMHDILEGVIPLHLKVMLRKFVQEKILSFDELNKRIHCFGYGPNDYKNKPSLLKNLTASDASIRQSASQMWCLSRLLPLMIHDLLPANNPDWELYTDLMKIVDILTSPVITKATTYFLQQLIKEYLEEFKGRYPTTKLIPKQHFMVHYPTQIRRNGPLVRQWCIRFEAKHHYFKRLAQGMTNFKNLPKTLATRHQRLQCYWLCEQDSYLNPVTEIGPGSSVELRDVHETKFNSLCSKCVSVTLDVKVFLVNWVVIHGVKYQKKAAVVYKHFIFPVFLRIEDIFVMPNGDVFFVCTQMRTIQHDRHLHSYEVRLNSSHVITTSYDELVDYHPLDVYTLNVNEGEKHYVRMRYDLADCEK